MKIFHITNELSEGGVGTFLLALLPMLKKAGNKVELLVLGEANSALVSDMSSQGITVHVGKYASIYDPRNIFLINSYIKQGNYDIVHAHLFPTQYLVSIAKMITKNNAKFITTEHGSYNKRRNRAILRPIEKMMYRRYDAIVGCSNDSSTNLKKWLACKRTKITTIANGINLQIAKTAIGYTKQELNLPDDAKILIMVARFFEAKDHKTVVKAVPFLEQNVHVLFCGSGEEGVKECQLLAQKLEVEERVHFLGNRKDISRLLKSSDVAVLSSFNEGMPLSLIEYMAAGLPSICTDVCGSQELAQNYGILFPVGDYECLAREVNKLLENKEYYNEVAQKCYNRAQDFSQETMMKNYTNLYKQLLCKKN